MRRGLTAGALTAALIVGGVGLAGPAAAQIGPCTGVITEGCVSFASTRADIFNAAFVTRPLARLTLSVNLTVIQRLNPSDPCGPSVCPTSPRVQLAGNVFRAQIVFYARTGAVTPAGVFQLTEDINALTPTDPF
jgi:hypothetical protein